MRKFMLMAALVLGTSMFGSVAATKDAQADWARGSIAFYASCMITHSWLFIQYDYSGNEAWAECW